MPQHPQPARPSAFELKFRSAMMRVAGERRLPITTRDIEALAAAAYRTLPKSRPPDTQPAPGRPFVSGDPRVKPPQVQRSKQSGTEGLTAADADLSDESLTVLRLVASGLDNGEIGYRLRLSPGQLKGRISKLYAVTGARSRAELVGWAAAEGLLADSGAGR